MFNYVYFANPINKKLKRQWLTQLGKADLPDERLLDIARRNLPQTYNQPAGQRINASAVRMGRDKIIRNNLDNVIDKEKYLQANLLQVRNKDTMANTYYDKNADMIFGTPRVNDYMDVPLQNISDEDNSLAAQYVRNKVFRMYEY